MKRTIRCALVFTGLLCTTALAGPVTDEERQYCAHDYRQYCSEDGLGSELLALCMRKHGKELSAQCIKALEDAGEVTPQEEAELEKEGK